MAQQLCTHAADVGFGRREGDLADVVARAGRPHFAVDISRKFCQPHGLEQHDAITGSSASMQNKKNSCLVYSTEHGKVCPHCGKPAAQCACANTQAAPKTDGIVRISRQTKGRKGKGVSCVTGIPLPQEQLEALAKQLKQRCGAGGTVKDGCIEIQGDHREALAIALKKLGYCVKLAGG